MSEDVRTHRFPGGSGFLRADGRFVPVAGQVGPEGPQGDPGAPGAPGATGPAGPTGPTGCMVFWPKTTPPSGWLICDGSVVSQATYPDLYAIIGSTFNTGDEGAGNFRLPNSKRRVLVGYDSTDTDFDTIGHTGGAKTHTHGTHTATGSAAGNESAHTHAGSGNTGAGGSHTHAMGASGVESGHTHASGGNTGDTTLTAAQSGVPAHLHSIGNHSHNANVKTMRGDNAGTAATYGFTTGSAGRMVDVGGTITAQGGAGNTDNSVAANATASHNHTDPATGASSGHTHSGSGNVGAEASHVHATGAVGAGSAHTHTMTNPTISAHDTVDHKMEYITMPLIIKT